MKFFGQNIQDFISRFRNDVFLESISSGTIASGGHLGLDSNNKIVKAAVSSSSGDITGVRLTGGDGNVASASSGSADFTLTGTSGVDTTVSGTTITFRAVNGEIDHDSLQNFVAAEHVDWASASAGTIHSSNIPTNIDTTGAAGTLTASTSNALGIGSIELGHASDTTIARSAAGIITVEGKQVRTADRQIQATYSSFTADDIDTKHYIAFNDGDSENTSTTNVDLPIIAPFAGKLLRVNLRCSRNITSHTMTFRLETQATGVNFSTGPTIVATQSGAGCNNTTMTTYDFTTGLDNVGESNVINAGDAVYLSIESNTSAASSKYYITCIWEWDYSSL